jgi:type VI secretion system secreted protein Hcp
MQEALVGVGQPCEIHLVETGADKLEIYLTVKLTNCLVSGYSMSSGGDRPSESLSINFTKIEYTYQGYDDQHKVDTSKKQTCIYDLATAKKG